MYSSLIWKENHVVIDNVQMKQIRNSSFEFPFKLENINQLDDILNVVGCEESTPMNKEKLLQYYVDVIVAPVPDYYSIETLTKLCSELDLNPVKEQDDSKFLNYISKVVQNLDEREKIIALLMDEIHLKSFFDYKGGNIVGGSYNNEKAAKTAYVFIIRSLLSKFKEVAHILPVCTIIGK